MCRNDDFNKIKRKEAWKAYSKKGQKEEDESETFQSKYGQI